MKVIIVHFRNKPAVRIEAETNHPEVVKMTNGMLGVDAVGGTVYLNPAEVTMIQPEGARITSATEERVFPADG